MHMPANGGEYSEAARLMRTLDRLRHAWGGIRPGPPVRRSDVMLLGSLVEQEHHGEPPLTVGELARKLHQSPSAITQKVNVLEEQGFITRTVSQSDRRVACVALTDRGREMARQSMQAFWDQLEKALAGMGEADVEALILLVDRLCGVLEESGTKTGAELD